MKKLFGFALFALVFLAFNNAEAATCFWVGGTANWDNTNQASWSSGTGGAGSTCAATGGIPKNAGDIAIFDAASGGGTVTVCGAASANCPTSSGVVSLAQITMGAFTGTLDFAAIDPSVTLTTAFSGTGTGSRILNMGDGVWTISAATGTVWDCGTVTSFTLNANASTLDFNTTATNNRTISFGSKTYNNVSFTNSAGNTRNIAMQTGSPTFAGTFTLTNVYAIRFTAGSTYTFSGSFTASGPSASQQGIIYTDAGAALTATFSVATAVSLSYFVIQNIIKAGAGSISATNSFDGGGNTGITITLPSGSGGGIIGG